MTPSLSPPRRALVVIDVQNEYFDGGLPIEYPPVERTLPNVLRAMDAARTAGVAVVVVQHVAPPGAPVFDKDTPRGRLHDAVAARAHDHFIEKRQASVFAGTDFADWLARHEIDTLTVAGYMTHNCDAATIYEAAHRGFKVEWLCDASGALPYANAAGRASAEEIHRVYSVVFHTGFAAVGSTDAWIAALQAGTRLTPEGILASNTRARQAAEDSAAR